MDMAQRQDEPRHPASLLWREQTQTRTTQLLAQGHDRIHDIGLPAWHTLKSEWQAFIRERCAPILQYQSHPIRARLIGETRRADFRVQNIVFESMPGWQVGLNLFLPFGNGPHVPVICPCGHGPKWQDDHQLPPQVLARNGFAAALFDMPMFGEKTRDNDHFIQGSQTGMAGVWSNLFFLIDALRVADYLQSRDDIDFSRGMGVTGVSGGGFATLFMAQLDPRVKAIAPVCSVAPLGGHVIDGLYTGCPENYLRGQAALGLDFDHLLCLAAPLPALVIGGTEDELFRPAQVQQSFDQARHIYALEGVPERLDLFFDHSPHKYTLPMANRAAAWMRRWLLGDETTQEIERADLLPESELNCGTAETTAGMLQFARRRAGELKQSRRADTSDGAIVALLGIETAAALQAPAHVEELPAAAWGYPHLRKHVLHADGDIALPAIHATFPSAPEGIAVCFLDTGKANALRQQGGLFGLCREIIAADLRGFGDLAPQKTDYDLYGWCGVDRALSDLLQLCGDTALGQQTRDALRVLSFAITTGAKRELIVYGRGEAALPALFAGLLHPQVTRIVLDSFLCSFDALATAPAPAWKRYAYLPDVLKVFDLPDLFRQRDDKSFLLINPCDADQERLDEVDAFRLYGLDDPRIAVRVDYDTRANTGFYATPGRADVKASIQHWLDSAPPSPQPLDPQLAIHGGRPARATPLPTKYLGADFTGLNELRNVRAAIGTKTLFRHYGLGKPVMAETFERAVREKFGVPYALGVTSGSAALVCGLAGLGIGPGDEVILPAFSWFSCYNAIALLGALPVFCDIDRSLNIDPGDAERKITARTKAIIAVHYQGSPADLGRLMDIARRHGISLLEDCAQAIGAKYKGQAVGTVGHVGTYSLQGNKLITSGEGGVVVTGDAAVFERAVRYHDLGFLRPTFKAQLGDASQLDEFVGTQYRMNETTAAVALAQLGRLDWIIERCHGSWCRLREKLNRTVPDLRFRHSYDVNGDAGITLYVDMQTPQRAKPFAEALAAEGIPLGPSSGMTNLLDQTYITSRHMAHPALPPFAPGQAGEGAAYAPSLAPRADDILNSMIAIAIGPRFTPLDVEDIANAVVKVARGMG
jgi:8-amino-3,8-dideoxy-alpha-D-manno-octulosonate transaminase